MIGLNGGTLGKPLALAAALAAGTASAQAPDAGLPVIPACFLTESIRIPVTLEVARTPKERQQGLMGRRRLAANNGMLFVYEEPRTPEHGFWMHNTLLPLDIAYVAGDGRIGSIRRMQPCPSDEASRCPTYPAGVSFQSAVEMNAGFFENHRIGTGDRLRVGAANCDGPQ